MAAGRRTRIAFLLIPAFAGLLVRLVGVPSEILLTAAVPALAWAIGLHAIARRPPGSSLAMLLWGSGVAAPLALVVNGILGGGELVAILGAPLVEEATKALGLVALLLLLPGEIGNARDGIVYGTLIGVGFAAIENASYLTLAAIQGGTTGLLSGLYLRGVLEGLNHAVFTGAVGAGIGWAREAGSERARALAPVVGFTAGVVQHVLWNAVASNAIRSRCVASTCRALRVRRCRHRMRCW